MPLSILVDKAVVLDRWACWSQRFSTCGRGPLGMLKWMVQSGSSKTSSPLATMCLLQTHAMWPSSLYLTRQRPNLCAMSIPVKIPCPLKKSTSHCLAAFISSPCHWGCWSSSYRTSLLRLKPPATQLMWPRHTWPRSRAGAPPPCSGQVSSPPSRR